jgi:hypothetical protein
LRVYNSQLVFDSQPTCSPGKNHDRVEQQIGHKNRLEMMAQDSGLPEKSH